MKNILTILFFILFTLNSFSQLNYGLIIGTNRTKCIWLSNHLSSTDNNLEPGYNCQFGAFTNYEFKNKFKFDFETYFIRKTFINNTFPSSLGRRENYSFISLSTGFLFSPVNKLWLRFAPVYNYFPDQSTPIYRDWKNYYSYKISVLYQINPIEIIVGYEKGLVPFASQRLGGMTDKFYHRTIDLTVRIYIDKLLNNKKG